MAYDYSDLVENTKRWLEQAYRSGWINKEAGQLESLDARAPNDLFNHSETRPLIVAFMGGTGVGKSSLLNRLAGKAVARTGIERPTSREVTLFHHQTVAIQNLPADLPLASITLAQHDDESKKNIIWIDMPDFDSTEQSNKHLVLQWLPHIDVLIYVVSPERYKDEKAWRLLLAESARHAWLFVLNQWDLGQFEQYDDFKLQLRKAGFEEPIIFKTACVEGFQADEFEALQSTIMSLATRNTIKELEQRNLQVRKDELNHKLQGFSRLLGSEAAFQHIPGLWQEQWQHAANLLQQGFIWPIQQLASYYAQHAADLITLPSTSRFSSAKTEAGLWDDWAQARFDDALDELIINAGQVGIPATPLKNQLAPIRKKAPKIIQAQSELAARQALANPGNVLHRVFLKFVRLCEFVLPFSAICWVGYQVFIGYYKSNMSDVDYLGVNFAVHSTLLIAISWLTPYFILKKLKPSLEKSALRGLNKGLTNAMSLIDNEVSQVLENIRHEHTEQVKQISAIREQCEVTDSLRKLSADSKNHLSRMLIN
ncbi:MAG: 50S ribosome-binding GTPase [Methylobacter sp.]|nr:50S ribosome-binding GTPase [Methylobacter sp.]